MGTERLSRPEVSVIDYSVGNIGALLNMFDHLGIEAEAVSDERGILDASRLVLPGIGAFDRAMRTLADRGLVASLNEAVIARRTPAHKAAAARAAAFTSSGSFNHAGRGALVSRRALNGPAFRTPIPFPFR